MKRLINILKTVAIVLLVVFIVVGMNYLLWRDHITNGTLQCSDCGAEIIASLFSLMGLFMGFIFIVEGNRTHSAGK